MEYSTRDFDPDDVRQRLYKPISVSEYRVVHLLPGRFSMRFNASWKCGRSKSRLATRPSPTNGAMSQIQSQFASRDLALHLRLRLGFQPKNPPKRRLGLQQRHLETYRRHRSGISSLCGSSPPVSRLDSSGVASRQNPLDHRTGSRHSFRETCTLLCCAY